jgi:hypothetical protein
VDQRENVEPPLNSCLVAEGQMFGKAQAQVYDESVENLPRKAHSVFKVNARKKYYLRFLCDK